MAALNRFLCSKNGNFATMTALVSPVAIVLCALAVDGGMFYLERREAQNVTDLAAIAAARSIADADELALLSFKDNGYAGVTIGNDPADRAAGHGDQIGEDGDVLFVTTGRYLPDPDTTPHLRFTPGATPPNAVKVEFAHTLDRFFSASLIDAPRLATSAIASATPEAAFSIGSRLLSLEGGILNGLLEGLLGTSISLSAMDYDALLETEVDVLSFVEEAGVALDLTAATYEEVLASQLSVDDLAGAISRTPGIGLAARTALTKLAMGAPDGATVPLASLLDLGTVADLSLGEVAVGLDATVGALPLLTSALALANGDNQVALDLSGTVPGLLDVDATLAIGEPPQGGAWYAIGPQGTVVRTVQMRLRLKLAIGRVLGSTVSLPLFLDVAYSEARVKDISCPDGPAKPRVTIVARPGIAELHIAEADIEDMHDFSRPPRLSNARLAHIPILLSVEARAHAAATNVAEADLVFTSAEIDAGHVETVGTRDPVTTLTRSLISDLDITLRPLGLGLGIPSGLTGVLAELVGSATPGISLGEADIRVHDAHCGRPVLVQ